MKIKSLRLGAYLWRAVDTLYNNQARKGLDSIDVYTIVHPFSNCGTRVLVILYFEVSHFYVKKLVKF